jgi:WD40 repeat protein
MMKSETINIPKCYLHLFATLIILGLINTGCAAAVRTAPVQTRSAPPEIPTMTATVTPSAAVTSTAGPNFDSMCWPVKPLEKGDMMKGGILYANFSREAGKSYSNDIFQWNLNSFQSIPVKITPYQLKFEDQEFQSPDGKLVALISENKLLIISQNSVRFFPLPLENLKIRTYLPNGQLLLDLSNHLSDYYQKGKGFTDIYYLFNPQTGETIKHSVFLPNFAPGKNLWTMQYSPDMKYVLYRSSSDEYNVQFTLYDLGKNEVLWVGPARRSDLENLTVPAWQPDSSALTTICADKTGYRSYYSISLDGKVSSLSNFGGAKLFGPTISQIWWKFDLAEFPDWSPNGRYLASTGYSKEEPQYGLPSLYIWDAQGKMLYKPCLPNEENRIYSQYSINWSFDGVHALTSLIFMQSPTPVEVSPGVYSPDYVSKSYILDLANKAIYEIPDLTDEKCFYKKMVALRCF